jgi:hypothetical protein
VVIAKAVFRRLDVRAVGVSAAPLAATSDAAEAVGEAAPAAAALATPLVVLDAGRLACGPGERIEDAVDAVARALHAIVSAWAGLSVALRPAGAPGRLLGFRETEWLLDALRAKPVGLWFDPARAAALCERGSLAGSPAPTALDWADRFGRRVLGVVLSVGEDGDPGGSAVSEARGGTLDDLLPSQAPFVLEAGPEVPRAAVVEARRRCEAVFAR